MPMRDPVISTSRFTLVFGSASALWFTLGLLPSLAGGTNCAAYGPEFAAVGGTDTCVRIGGRVRVEAGSGITPSSINNGWASGGARPASLHSETGNPLGNGADFGRSHLRLPQGALGYADPSH